MGQDVVFDVIARDRASGTFSKVGKNAKGAESNLSRFGSTAKKAVGALIAFQGIKTVTSGLIGMAKAAAEDQTSVALLAKQMKNSAHATSGQIAQTERYVDALGRSQGVTDDVARNSLGTLIAATHSVTKAQKLNNLALDVAAAKGKPLAAVSLALAKAYNGNVGALGRLGIKTKDAKGKTLEFADAQSMLQRQFGGAAATKAKTFTGVMDRFQVVVNEAGEAVGYKLLPELTKIVPKVSKFITGLQDGTGAGGRFADTLKTNVVPVLQNVAAEGKLVFGALKPFFELLTKLPAPVVAFGGAAGILGGKIGGLRTPLAEGSSGFAKFGRAASSAAGGAGLLAVADAANRTSPALGGLEGALGGAVAGFSATGNPIGALIGGVGGGLLGIFSASKRAAGAISAADQATHAYKDTLNNTTGAVTALTRSLAEQSVSGKHLDGVLGTYGYTHRQIVDGIVKGGPLRSRMIAQLQAEYKATNDTAQAIIDKHGTSSQEYADYVKSNKGRQDAVSAALTELGAVQKATKAKQNEIAATRIFSKAIKQLPPRVQTQFTTVGLKPTRRAIVDLVRQFPKLTDRQIGIVIKENGGKPTAAKIKKLRDDAKALGKLAPTLNTAPVQAGLVALLNGFKSKVSKGAPVIKPGLSGRGASVTLAGVLANLQRQANSHPIVIKTKGGGGGGDGIPGDGIGSDGRRAPGGLMAQLAAQIAKGTPKVKVALDRAKGLFQAFTDKVNSLKDTRAGFLSTFSSDSIFGADSETTGGTLNGLLQFQQQQASNASQLLNDIKSVTSKGLSKGLVSQLQAAGSAGAAQLHLLAGGSANDISQFNALNAQTTASNAQAGLIAGNFVRGGNIDSDIKSAQQNAALTKAIITALGSLKLEAKVKGGDIIIAVAKTNHDRGRAPGDFSR